MKKRMNIQFMIIAVIAIILTAICSGFIFYEALKKEVMEELESYAKMLVELEAFRDIDEDGSERYQNKFRITLVESDGTVCYDSKIVADTMENHSSRPEIQSAMVHGEGSVIRKSGTLQSNTFYYAIEMQDGRILRVSKEAKSILQLLMNSLPVLVLIGVILFAVCAGLSHLLTRSVVKPIEEMAKDMNKVAGISVYQELLPFLTTIQEQHRAILKNSNMRQEFTANVSHELKTPLASISGYSELIVNGMANEKESRRFAKEIHSNSKRLLTLINDIIRLSELDSQNFSMEFEKVNLFEIARNCVNMLQMNAEKHKVSIDLYGENAYVFGNYQMLEEMIFNLCENAIRYNKENGSVLVEVKQIQEMREEKYADNTVILRVKDTGIGIPKEHQERIFERFYRVDKSRSKSTGGTGLGLAIVKHIVAGHPGATIELESEAEIGTEVRVKFNT